MKSTLVIVFLIALCGSTLADEPKKNITIPLHETVSKTVFRVESITADPPRRHIIRQYTVLHSVTDGTKGLGFRITSHGHPSRIEAYQFDRKTGKRIPSEKNVNYVLTNIHDLLLSDKSLSSGDEYVLSFQHYDGYHYLVDAKKKEPPTKKSTLSSEGAPSDER